MATYTGEESFSIGLDDATRLTTKYRETVSIGEMLATYFSKAALNKILGQNGCVGVRIYNGLTAGDQHCFVLVGIRSDGEDIYDGDLAEHGLPCPPYCPLQSPLGS
jgi:hypothetical protein